MPKKRFEEEPYNPLTADLVRDAALGAGRAPKPAESQPAVPGPPVAQSSRTEPRVLDLAPWAEGAPALAENDGLLATAAANQLTEASEGKLHAIETNVRAVEPAGPTKRYKVTHEEDHELASFMLTLRRASNTKITLGMINRAANAILIQALPQILTELEHAPELYQPPNNDAVAYAEFEEGWIRIIDRALRRRRVPR